MWAQIQYNKNSFCIQSKYYVKIVSDSHLLLGEKTIRPAEGGTPNSLGKLGGNQWGALRGSHALGSSVSFSKKKESI